MIKHNIIMPINNIEKTYDFRQEQKPLPKVKVKTEKQSDFQSRLNREMELIKEGNSNGIQ